MSIIVTKFGGTSLADAAALIKVRDIIKADPKRRYVIPSAPGKRHAGDEKVTDLLYKCHQLALAGQPFDEPFANIRRRFEEMIAELGLSLDLTEHFEEIRRRITPDSSPDYTASRGEYLNGLIVAALLGIDFVDAAEVVVFDDQGCFDAETTNRVMRQRLSQHERAVIPGFYGQKYSGGIRTFSRGGSDITGSIVARAVSAQLYENWTDVSGFMMADPRIVPNPNPIDVITYRELRELAYMGATVLHEDAIFPVRHAGIPINIRNSNAPADPGTMIVPATSETCSRITGIAGKKDFCILSVEKAMMNNELGVGRRLLEVLEKNQIPFEHLPTGIDTMSVVIAKSHLEGRREAVLEQIHRELMPDSLDIQEDLALIATVGRGMIRIPGTAGMIFQSLAEAGINIRMIDQGSSEMNIIIGVEQKDFERAVQAIYKGCIG